MSSAPLVEGLVAAVVTASTGASLDAVATEAERGLLGKQDHLGDGAAAESTTVAETDQTVEVVVGNEHGLHARPAARLVGLVNCFDATVTLTDLDTDRGPVDAGSLSMVATLNAQQGHRLRVGAAVRRRPRRWRRSPSSPPMNFGDATVPTCGELPGSARWVRAGRGDRAGW